MALEKHFQTYFEALDRSGNKDCCFLCCRTAAEVKRFFGFEEDGVPVEAADFGIEDVVLESLDIMSYRGLRPICAVCQLNHDALGLLGERPTVDAVLDQVYGEREHLWPDPDSPG